MNALGENFENYMLTRFSTNFPIVQNFIIQTGDGVMLGSTMDLITNCETINSFVKMFYECKLYMEHIYTNNEGCIFYDIESLFGGTNAAVCITFGETGHALSIIKKGPDYYKVEAMRGYIFMYIQKMERDEMLKMIKARCLNTFTNTIINGAFRNDIEFRVQFNDLYFTEEYKPHTFEAEYNNFINRKSSSMEVNLALNEVVHTDNENLALYINSEVISCDDIEDEQVLRRLNTILTKLVDVDTEMYRIYVALQSSDESAKIIRDGTERYTEIAENINSVIAADTRYQAALKYMDVNDITIDIPALD